MRSTRSMCEELKKRREEQIRYLKQYAEREGIPFIEAGAPATPNLEREMCKPYSHAYIVFDYEIVECIDHKPVNHIMLAGAGYNWCK